ncbi:MAG: hypothetical protein ACE5LU_12525 [Anaerolineae bacterium]
MARKPYAVANWKMAMTAADTLAFARDFRPAVADLAAKIDIVKSSFQPSMVWR